MHRHDTRKAARQKECNGRKERSVTGYKVQQHYIYVEVEDEYAQFQRKQET